jgi:hypothetical protein
MICQQVKKRLRRAVVESILYISSHPKVHNVLSFWQRLPYSHGVKMNIISASLALVIFGGFCLFVGLPVFYGIGAAVLVGAIVGK